MNKYIPYVVITIFALGAGFFGGMRYQIAQGIKHSQFTNGNALFQMGNGQRIQGTQGQGFQTNGASNKQGYRMGGRPVSGEIISADEKSVTVKSQDGNSKIVILSDKTSINKATEAAVTDLKVGEKVLVMGQENSDGSVTAQNIQLNPQMKVVTAPAPQQ